MSAGALIDMSKLPAPDVVQQLDFETTFADLKADFIAAYPLAAAVLELESEPLTILLQRLAYQLLLRRQEENESALAVMLAYSTGADLDNLGAIFGVQRLTIVTADLAAVPPVVAVMEDDEALRARIQIAPQGFSVAGPVGAYVFHARSADGLVLDASAISPSPGTIVVSVLSRDGDGTASVELLAAVDRVLQNEQLRPLTDEVLVQSAEIVPYQVLATVFTLAGPDSSSVLANSQKRISAYVLEQHRLGRSPTLSGIYAALHAEGVHHVVLASPTADMAIGPTQAAWCTSFQVTFGGTVDG